jgi:Listeria-Bacteroides repeat domain (List_Bact_rpt)/OmpA family
VNSRGPIADKLIHVAVISACLSIIALAVPTFGGATTIHTVTFFENDNGGDATSTFQASTTPQNLTTYSNLSVPFSNSGYTFDDWNTEANGSGVPYGDGANYSFLSDISLFAQWTAVPTIHIVTFFENDSGGDNTNTFQSSTAPQNLTTFSNLNVVFSNPGYSFNDWNTAPNGGGTSYANGSNYSFTGDASLYAQWTADPTVTATFNTNEGVGTVAPIVEPSGSTIALPTGAALIRNDFTLNGWNTSLDGAGTEYSLGASLILNVDATYYAQWTQTTPFEVQFVDNGGSGVDSSLSGNEGTTVTLPGSAGLTELGYMLTSWNTAANGFGTSYALNQSLSLSEPLTLYAQWTASATPITISFAANGGSGSLSQLSGASGANVTLPGASSIVRPGYSLSSWNSASNGSGTSYSLGQSLTLTSTLTLYAQWKSVPTSTLFGAVGTFTGRTTSLSPALEKQVRTLAAAVKTRKYTKVLLFGFSAATGVTSLDHSLSAARANSVANYLRSELRSMNVTNVDITTSGQGSVDGSKSAANSRVEVFVT